MPEDPPPPVTSDAPDSAANLSRGAAGLPDGARLTDAIVSRFAEQARQTASAARARRVASGDGDPGVLDLTPLRELLAELGDELGKLGLRNWIGRTLRQAADIIDPQAPIG